MSRRVRAAFLIDRRELLLDQVQRALGVAGEACGLGSLGDEVFTGDPQWPRRFVDEVPGPQHAQVLLLRLGEGVRARRRPSRLDPGGHRLWQLAGHQPVVRAFGHREERLRARQARIRRQLLGDPAVQATAVGQGEALVDHVLYQRVAE